MVNNKSKRKVSFFERTDMKYNHDNHDNHDKYNIISISILSITSSLLIYGIYRMIKN